jgi:hypothetical protein
MNIRPNSTLLALVAVTALAACGQDQAQQIYIAQPTAPPPPQNQAQRNPTDNPTKDPAEQSGAYAGGVNNTYSHADDLGAYGGRNPFDILAQREDEGPPEVRNRLHSCQKLAFASIGNVLASFGVDMSKKSTPPSAGQLYSGGAGALGAADYDARVSEATTWSTAGAAKLFDIFAQAAPEIIANFSTLDQCKVDGVVPELFDSQNHCNIDALSCLLGKPARQAHVDICNQAITQASSVDTGKAIAVATLLAAAHSCE